MINNKRQPFDFRLYAITNRLLCQPRVLYDVIHDLLDVGVTAIQLREKDLENSKFFNLAAPIAKLCQAYSACLFINSRVEIALDLGVSGLHCPASVSSMEQIKTRTRGSLLIGCSIHSLNEARAREKEGADFITYSPIFPTASKPGYGPAVGLKNLDALTSAVEMPVFALGGVSPKRVQACIEAGAHGVAVMSGVMSPKAGINRAREYLRELEKCGA